MESEVLDVVIVAGSAGYLGAMLCRELKNRGNSHVIGVDKLASEFTTHVGSITDKEFLFDVMKTLGDRSTFKLFNQLFVDVNIQGTVNLLDLCVEYGCKRFIFTSTTSVFGHAMKAKNGKETIWVTEELTPIPKNIYGITKLAAEHMCKLYHDLHHISIVVLRTSRFFPEDDYDREPQFDYLNARVNELVYRRIDKRDVLQAHLSAMEKAEEIEYGMFIISGRTPFTPADIPRLEINASEVLFEKVPLLKAKYKERKWQMMKLLDRVYDASLATRVLGFVPTFDYMYHVFTDYEEIDNFDEEKPYL